MAQKIKIGVDTGKTLPLSYLTPMQGALKEVTPQAIVKLKASILKHGFIFPFFVWENSEDAKIYLIDGHTRLLALTELKASGHSVPQLPVVFIDASSLDNAKEKLLAVASQYGKFTEAGVSEFLGSFTFVPEDMFKSIDIPFLNFDPTSIMQPDTTIVSEHERVLNDYSEEEIEDKTAPDFRENCPHCGEKL